MLYKQLADDFINGASTQDSRIRLLDSLAECYQHELDLFYATRIDYTKLDLCYEDIEPLNIKKYIYGKSGVDTLDIPFIQHALSPFFGVDPLDVPEYLEEYVQEKAIKAVREQIQRLHTNHLTDWMIGLLPEEDVILTYCKSKLQLEEDFMTEINQSIEFEHMLVDYWLLGEELPASLPYKEKYYYQDTLLWKTLFAICNTNYRTISRVLSIPIVDLLAIQRPGSILLSPKKYEELLSYLLHSSRTSITYSFSSTNGEISGVRLHKIPILLHKRSLPLFFNKERLLREIPSIDYIDENKPYCGRPCIYVDMSFQFGFEHTKDTILMRTNS